MTNGRYYVWLTLITLGAVGLSAARRNPSVSAHDIPHQYPHTGDLYYGGASNADSYMNWHMPGNWQGADKAVEIDISVVKEYFDACTIATDLPINYDDCPTAGTLEPDPNRLNFGMGTYDGTQIVRNYWYRGYWYFSGGSAMSTDVNQTWGEVERKWYLCNDRYNIWCYANVRGGSLVTGQWNWGTPTTLNYLYDTN
jgi:hypothetical protein